MKNKMNLFWLPLAFFISMFVTAEVYEGGSGKQFFFTAVMLVCCVCSMILALGVNFGDRDEKY